MSVLIYSLIPIVSIACAYYYRHSIKTMFKVSTIFLNTLGTHKSQSDFVIDYSQNFATVSVSDRNFIIPFDRSKVAKMLSLMVETQQEDGTTKNITQSPGIPYLLSPMSLGVSRIVVTNMDSGDVVFYVNDEIPNYCDEAF